MTSSYRVYKGKGCTYGQHQILGSFVSPNNFPGWVVNSTSDEHISTILPANKKKEKGTAQCSVPEESPSGKLPRDDPMESWKGPLFASWEPQPIGSHLDLHEREQKPH